MLAIILEKAVILGQKKLPKIAMLMIRLRLDFKELEKIVNLPLLKVELFWITNEGRCSVTSKCLEIQTISMWAEFSAPARYLIRTPVFPHSISHKILYGCAQTNSLLETKFDSTEVAIFWPRAISPVQVITLKGSTFCLKTYLILFTSWYLQPICQLCIFTMKIVAKYVRYKRKPMHSLDYFELREMLQRQINTNLLP